MTAHAIEELSDEERAEVESTGATGTSEIEVDEKPTTMKDRFAAAVSEEAAEKKDEIPEWATIPDGLKIPKGVKVAFMFFRAKWTARPDLGDRWCMVWPLSVSDEKLARKRVMDSNEAVPELSKQMVRVIDGKIVDWTGKAATEKAKLGQIKAGGDLNSFWQEIGPQCRQMVQNYYLNTHLMPAEDQLDFFANCIVVRNADGS